MPTIAEVRSQFPQYNDMSDTDLAGALHDKFYSDIPADEFAQKIGLKPPEPTTVDNAVRSFATGVPIVGGLLNRMNAATNAALAPAVEPFLTPSADDISRHGESFSQRYDKSLAMQNAADDKFASDHPNVDTALKFTGAVVGSIPMVAAAPESLVGLTGGLAQRMVMSGLSNAALGGADAAIRGGDTLTAAGIGGALGMAGPVVGAVAHGLAAPVVSNIRARINPEGYAQSQVARAIAESGRTPEALGRAVEDANASGQPYTLADALGNPGQRMLGTVTRAPGEGRTNAVEFLNSRQAGQGERVGDIIDQGLGTGNTARQTIDQLTETARREAEPLYRDALNRQPVWNDRMQQFFDDPVTARGLTEGVGVQRLESLASGRPFNPHDYAITNFNEAGDPVIGAVPNMRTINLIKKGWDNILEGYRDGTTGRLVLDEHGRALDQVRRAFLREVDALNPTYGRARAAYAGPAQVRDAVVVGQQAATRGRAADNLARFDTMTEPTRQGFRAGYADSRVGTIERNPPGTNAVRTLSSQKARSELSAMSLHQGPVQPGAVDPMAQRLAREQTMFETRNQALGNSKTAENLADNEAMGVNPELIGQVITGNLRGAVRSVIASGTNGLTGNTPAVRAAVGRMLLDRGVTAANLQNAIGDAVARIQFAQHAARTGIRSVTAAATLIPNQKPVRRLGNIK